MDRSLGNIYPILENPEEGETDRYHSGTSFNVKMAVTKKFSSSSLPEKQNTIQKNDLIRKDNSIPTLILTEVETKDRNLILSGSKASQKTFNRLAVSLLDFPSFGLAKYEEIPETDKKIALSSMTLSHMISEKSSKSYLNIHDRTSYSNREPEYEVLLSPTSISNVSWNQIRKSDTQNVCQNKERKNSENFEFIDLSSDDDGYQKIENSVLPNVSRQRASSVQWIQNAFQNVSSKYKDLLEFRRPSDIVEESIRKSKEGIDMEESESEATDINQNSSVGNRRFSENIIGKQKRFPFVGRLHLKGFWKDKNLGSKRQEVKENDQTRTDVCPLFSFPRKKDEDELILDTLRQAMRKCTAVDPSSRPTSTIVFDQLSNLLN